MQENWIGRSEGARVYFAIAGPRRARSRSSRRGPTRCSAPRSWRCRRTIRWRSSSPQNDPALAEFIAECDRMGTSEAVHRDRREARLSRPGSRRCIRSTRAGSVPVYVANFVLMEYGTGAIFGCPAHDQRDLDFARKYGLPVIPVVLPPGEDPASFTIGDTAYVEDGTLFNSDFLDGLSVADAKRAAGERLEAARARRAHDRLSPARLGRVAAALLGLPDPGHPLRRMRHRAGAGAGSAGRHCREDVSFDAAGQSARPPSDLEARRLPALRRPGRARDRHVRHLLRIRPGISCASARRARRSRSSARRSNTGCRSTSISAASSTPSCICSIRASSPARLKQCGYLDLDEPFAGLFTQGMVCHQTYQNERRRMALPGGGRRRRATVGSSTPPAGRSPSAGIEKMSKSKKNVVGLDAIVDTYGADTARLYLLSDSPPERDLEWTETGIEGIWRYVNRLWRMVTEPPVPLPPPGSADAGRSVAGADGDPPRDPQDDRRGHRRSRQIPLQPRRRAHPRADQRARRAAGGRARRRRGAARRARSRWPGCSGR